MVIEKKKISELKSAPYNPRKSNREQEGKLRESLEKFGVVEPVVFNKRTGYIVGGHFRVRELKKLGYDEVECVIVDLNEEDERELNIRLNANSGDWDSALLAINFTIPELIDWGFNGSLAEVKENINTDKEFLEEFSKVDDSNCVMPIIPELGEKNELFIIVSDSEVDSNWLRGKLGMNKMKSYKSDKVAKSNVIHIKDLYERL